MTLKQWDTLRFATIRLKWKTVLRQETIMYATLSYDAVEVENNLQGTGLSQYVYFNICT